VLQRVVARVRVERQQHGARAQHAQRRKRPRQAAVGEQQHALARAQAALVQVRCNGIDAPGEFRVVERLLTASGKPAQRRRGAKATHALHQHRQVVAGDKLNAQRCSPRLCNGAARTAAYHTPPFFDRPEYP
jgi:beta-phosphoglucomutase-like phosphatase (HAD superfamily)